MSYYTPTGLPFESQELPCTVHPFVEDPLCVTCQYAQIQRHLNREQAQRARVIIDQAIQNHSVGQYAAFGERSLEQDIWHEIQAQARSLESGSRGRDLDDLTLSRYVNPSDLVISDPNEQGNFERQIADNAGGGGNNLMPGGSHSSSMPLTEPDQLDASFDDSPDAGVNETKVRSEKNVTVDEDHGIMPNRCQRCSRLKKGCDRRRPCQRCKHAGLDADGCIPQVGLRRPARLPRGEKRMAEGQDPSGYGN